MTACWHASSMNVLGSLPKPSEADALRAIVPPELSLNQSTIIKLQIRRHPRQRSILSLIKDIISDKVDRRNVLRSSLVNRMPRPTRDDFTRPTIELLAKRAGYRCSNPDCRRPTSGPDGSDRAVSLGVAAHITAAAEGGERYDGSLSSVERRAYDNGIWLCQQCSRHIDVDVASHPIETLLGWKHLAEAAAYVELRGFDVVTSRNFAGLERKMPELVAEMREDLKQAPFTRQFIVMASRRMGFNGSDTPLFTYYGEEHDALLGKLEIMTNYGAISDATINRVPRYRFSEDFAEYLLGS